MVYLLYSGNIYVALGGAGMSVGLDTTLAPIKCSDFSTLRAKQDPVAKIEDSLVN